MRFNVGCLSHHVHVHADVPVPPTPSPRSYRFLIPFFTLGLLGHPFIHTLLGLGGGRKEHTPDIITVCCPLACILRTTPSSNRVPTASTTTPDLPIPHSTIAQSWPGWPHTHQARTVWRDGQTQTLELKWIIFA